LNSDDIIFTADALEAFVASKTDKGDK
jgi:hypothetical protein